MRDPLKGTTQTAQTRLKDGRQILAIGIDRDGVANLLDRPDAFALLELTDFLGHGAVTLLLMAAERESGEFEPRLRSLLASLSRGETQPGPALEERESGGEP